MNDEIKEMTKVLKSLGNKQASELYYYITNLQHTEDLYNQLLKDYDDEVEENIKLTKLWKNEVEKRRKAVEYIEPKVINEYIHTDYIYTMLDILRGEDK